MLLGLNFGTFMLLDLPGFIEEALGVGGRELGEGEGAALLGLSGLSGLDSLFSRILLSFFQNECLVNT